MRKPLGSFRRTSVWPVLGTSYYVIKKSSINFFKCHSLNFGLAPARCMRKPLGSFRRTILWPVLGTSYLLPNKENKPGLIQSRKSKKSSYGLRVQHTRRTKGSCSAKGGGCMCARCLWSLPRHSLRRRFSFCEVRIAYQTHKNLQGVVYWDPRGRRVGVVASNAPGRTDSRLRPELTMLPSFAAQRDKERKLQWVLNFMKGVSHGNPELTWIIKRDDLPIWIWSTCCAHLRIETPTIKNIDGEISTRTHVMFSTYFQGYARGTPPWYLQCGQKDGDGFRAGNQLTVASYEFRSIRAGMQCKHKIWARYQRCLWLEYLR